MKKNITEEMDITDFEEYYSIDALDDQASSMGLQFSSRSLYIINRLEYLKYERPDDLISYITDNSLVTCLIDLNIEAREYEKRLIAQIAEHQNINDELKAEDEQRWMNEMNMIKHQAQEIVNEDLIFC